MVVKGYVRELMCGFIVLSLRSTKVFDVRPPSEEESTQVYFLILIVLLQREWDDPIVSSTYDLLPPGAFAVAFDPGYERVVIFCWSMLLPAYLIVNNQTVQRKAILACQNQVAS